MPNPWVVSAVLRAAGGAIAPDEVPRAHYAGVAAMDARRTTDWSYYHRVFVRFAGVPINRIDDALAGLASLFRSPVPTTWNVVPTGVIEQLRDLAATGVAIAVVSNADGLVEATLRRCEIPFDVVIDSTIVGYAKPQPEIFAFALEKLNVAAAMRCTSVTWRRRTSTARTRPASGPLHLDPFGDCPYPARPSRARAFAR